MDLKSKIIKQRFKIKMKGLSTLNSSRAKKQGSGLMTLSGRNISFPQSLNLSTLHHQQYQTKVYYPCAYHVGERITNFCVNESCLLPLCPKCIKIHASQHETMGVYGNFPTVEECLTECQGIQTSSILRLEQMSKLCEEMSSLHRQQIVLCQSQLEKAKQQLLDYINTIFKFYQQETDRIILQTSRQYQDQLRLFQQEILMLTMSERQLAKKAENQNTKMEFLIDFHSKQDLTSLLNQHAATIDSFKPNYLQLSVNTYELQRTKVIISKYLDFGIFNQSIHQNLQNNLLYKRITIHPNIQPDLTQNAYSFSGKDQKQFIRSPIRNLFSSPSQFDSAFHSESQNYGFAQKGQIAKMIEQKLHKQSRLDRFQSPLEAYSLQKSRQNRT